MKKVFLSLIYEKSFSPFFHPRFNRAKKINTVAQWTGVVGGTIGLIISAFMVFKKYSRKEPISTGGPTANNGKSDLTKTLKSIKHLDNKLTETVGVGGLGLNSQQK